MKLMNFRPFDPACPLSPGLTPGRAEAARPRSAASSSPALRSISARSAGSWEEQFLSYADAVVKAVGVESGPEVVDCPTGAGKTRAIQPLAMAPHSTTD